jgi:hypothetical protein
MRIHSWVMSMAGVVALAMLLSLWHPWTAEAASLNHPAPATATQAPSLSVITWQQATLHAPPLARVPSWLPSGVSTSQLVRDPVHGLLIATYTGPDHAWTIQIQENPGPTTASNPDQRSGTISGHPVTLSQWQSTSGAKITNVFFTLNGNGYDVLGINVPMAIVEKVTSGLISH